MKTLENDTIDIYDWGKEHVKIDTVTLIFDDVEDRIYTEQ